MDNLDRLNQKLRNRERIFGYTVYLPNTYMQMEYMPKGVDFVLLDCEHGPHDAEYYSEYYRHFRMLGIPTITRIADAEYHLAARAADCGSDGLMIPRVETLEQVDRAVEGLYLPPVGKKGYGCKHMWYPNESIDEYNRRRMLWIQIESPEGADELPKILEKYGHLISAVIIGPCDLSVRMGTPLDFYNEKTLAVIKKVYDLCEQYGVSSGSYAASLDEASRRVGMNANLIWLACDVVYLTNAIQQMADAVADM